MASKSNLEVEVTREGFEVEKFIDNVMWQCFNFNEENLDFARLLETFERAVTDLSELREEMKNKERLAESSCRLEEQEHRLHLVEVKKRFDTLLTNYQTLDERIHYVAAKVVHLGDQLEGANAPRMRVHESRTLLQEYFRFMNEPNYVLDQTHENMELIHKLNTLSAELPDEGVYHVTRERITGVHGRLETGLLQQFRAADNLNNLEGMRQLVESVSMGHSRAYANCIDYVIAQALKNITIQNYRPQDGLLNTVIETQKKVKKVFSQYNSVMARFVQALFADKITTHVKDKLRPLMANDLNSYLTLLQALHRDVTEFAEKLTSDQAGISVDPALVHKCIKDLFQTYMDSYSEKERQFLNERLWAELRACDAEHGHQRRAAPSGGLLFNKIRDIRNMAGVTDDELVSDRSLLSETLAANIIQEIRTSCQRCQQLSNASKVSENALQIYEILFQILLKDHIIYGVEQALLSQLPTDQKPSLTFIQVSRDANHLYHMFETLFHKNILPLLNSETQRDCAAKKNAAAKDLEQKITTGIDKTLNAVISHVNTILSEQRKSDFDTGEGRGDNEAESIGVNPNGSVTADKVCQYIVTVFSYIDDTLDGSNRDCVLTELGLRFHRAILDHLYKFSYSKEGGQTAVLDVHKYAETIQTFKLDLVRDSFSVLKKLVVLLIVSHVADCYKELLPILPKEVITQFVQLRLDFKSSRLNRELNQIREDAHSALK